MRAYDEERGDQSTPISKVHDKLTWQTEVREELEEMNSDDTFYVVIKDNSSDSYFDSVDFSYHRTEQLALEMISDLALEMDIDFDPSTENSFYVEGKGTAFVEYYIEERNFSA